MGKSLSFSAILLAGALSAASASAATLAVFNTGIDGNANGRDDNWNLQGVGAPFVPTSINGAWLPNNASGTNSKWITPTSDGNASLDPLANAQYIYSLSFVISSGFNPLTAVLNGRWLSDNNSVVSLNANNNSIVSNANLPSGAQPYNTWTSFSLPASAFIIGNNSLTFNVTNIAQTTGNPSGLRVEFLENSISPVPEPGEWAMMLSGLALVGLIAKRRRRTDAFAA